MKWFAFVCAMVMCLGSALADHIILPKLKPLGLVAAEPSPTPIAFPPGSGSWPESDVVSARQACAVQLKNMDMDFQTLPPLGRSGGCGTAAPLMISAIAGVRIEPPMESTCALAESLHHWVAWAVKPAAAKHLGKQLTVINNASAYACRRRNNSASGKLSEHAFANALDIATLQFDDGSRITIKGDWSGLQGAIGASAKASFLKTIREYACLRFTTVLGPGSDKYHGDHFHVDLARRRSGYRICK